jgi:hypothetical protein
LAKRRQGHPGHHPEKRSSKESDEHPDHHFPADYIYSVDQWKNHTHHTHEKEDPVMGHEELLAKGSYSCDDVVEKWHDWLFKIPAAVHPNLVLPSNSYKAESGGYPNPIFVGGNRVYMTAFVPLTKKEDNIITYQIYEDTDYILLPIMTAEACSQEYPSLKNPADLWKMVQNETDSVDKIVFTIDSITRMGCYVERKTRLPINNVANENLMGIKPQKMKPNNTVEIIYSGFWALLDVKRLGSGDHLLTVEATGKTYFVGATIALNVLR